MEMENLLKISSANDKHYKLWNYKGSIYCILLVHQVGSSQPAPHTWSAIKMADKRWYGHIEDYSWIAPRG